jgi:hypothetical protein
MLTQETYHRYVRRSATLLVAIYVINTIAHRFNWYYTFWWFDIPLHFLGGYFIGLLTISLLEHPKLNRYFKSWSKLQYAICIFSLVLLVGFLWEVFEWGTWYFFSVTNIATIIDSFSDMAFDLAGAVAFLFLEYRKDDIL